MGIGTTPNLEKSLASCVKAALNGYIPAVLTSISLFEACRQAEAEFRLVRSDQLGSDEEPDLAPIIERWTEGDWEATIDCVNKVDSETGCRLTLPRAFTETPAARRLCGKYATIRAKLCTRTCTCIPQLVHDKVESSRIICGWQLLSELAGCLQRITLHREVGSAGLQSCNQLGDLDTLLSKTLDFRDTEGHTLVHYVAASLDWNQTTLTKSVDLLVSAGLEIVPPDANQPSLVLLAIRSGNSRVALHLLKEHKVLNGRHIGQECREAIRAGEWTILDELLTINEVNPAPGRQICVDSLFMDLCSTSWFYRVVCGGDCLSVTGMNIMIQHGGNIRYHNERNTTLLTAAVSAGNSDLAEYILNELSTIDQTNESSNSDVTLNPLGISEENMKYLNMVDDDGANAISEAIRLGNEAMTLKLLRLGVNLEWSFEGYRLSALQLACQTLRYVNSSKLFEELSARESNANIEDERGNTILHYIAFGTHGLDTAQAMEGVFNYIKSPGKLINQPNKEGQTPLHFAVSGGVVTNVRYLLEKGAHVGIADVRGYTVLHLATDDLGDNNYEILSQLLDKSNKNILNIRDQWGRTALMHAAGKHFPKDHTGKDINGNEPGKAIKLLLKKGASEEIRDNYGQNVLHHYYGRRAENEFQGHDYKCKSCSCLRQC